MHKITGLQSPALCLNPVNYPKSLMDLKLFSFPTYTVRPLPEIVEVILKQNDFNYRIMRIELFPTGNYKNGTKYFSAVSIFIINRGCK